MWLREVLSESGLMSDSQAIGTHSAKATVLSWMCKAHASGDLQRLAGYHVDPGSKSSLEYSRDGQAPLLHFVEGMLLAIYSGLFLPDETRAGRWKGCRSLEQALDKLAQRAKTADEGDPWKEVESQDLDAWASFDDAEAGLKLAAADTEDVEDNAPESDLSEGELDEFHLHSSASEGNSEDDHEQDEQQMDFTGTAVAGLLSSSGKLGHRVFRHRLSGIFHLMADENVPDDDGEMSSTKCGKLISHNFEEVEQRESFLPTKCKRCFTQ